MAEAGGRTLLLEIGVEELPAELCAAALEQLRTLGEARLQAERLSFARSWTAGTPRRLAWLVEDLAERQLPAERAVRGPAAGVAFDGAGRPTAAAQGFARSQGVAVEALQVREVGGKAYVFAVHQDPGRDTGAVLAAAIPELVAALRFPRTMRWGDGDFRFPRPIRWLVLLWGAEVVPCAVAGVTAGRVSYGHRALHPGPVVLPDAAAYAEALRAACVVVDRAARRQAIADGLLAAAARVGGRPRLAEGLLEEVTDLCEWPTAFVGRFDPQALALPEPVLVTVMRHHQRYFPVEGPEGRLLPHFAAVRNGDAQHLEQVVRGNERVLAARFADARFFYEEDRAEPLAARVGRLESVAFAEGLGTLADKTRRLVTLARALAGSVGVPEPVAVRAAELAKADRLTHLVYELPELEGTMGGHYALLSGEAPEVAQAIAEHVLPRAAGDELPLSPAGQLLAVADRLDTLAGHFVLGRQPSGGADPYGLRRAAAAVIRILEVAGWDLPLDWAVRQALAGYGSDGADPAALRAFLRQRLAARLQELGFRHDVAEAVLAVEDRRVADAVRRCQALTEALAAEGWEDTLIAFRRAGRLARQGGYAARPAGEPPAMDGLVEPAERRLAAALRQASDAARAAQGRGDYRGVLAATAQLRAPVDAFLTELLVMDADAAVRQRRLALLAAVAAIPAAVADLERLQGA